MGQIVPEERARLTDDLFTAADRREVTAGERETDTRAAGEPDNPSQPEAGLAGIIGNMRSQSTGEPRLADSARDAAIGRRAGIAAARKAPELLAAREEQLGFDYTDRHARRGHEATEPGHDRDDGPGIGD